MINYSCDTCMWFDKKHESLKGCEENYGYCRKHKPIIYAKETRYYGGWPLVDRLDLCGEYRKDQE